MKDPEKLELLDFISIKRFFSLQKEEIKYKSIIVMISVAICLTINRFAVGETFFLIQKYLPPDHSPEQWKLRFYQLIYWAFWCFISYFVIPVLVTKFILKTSVRKQGIKIKGIHKNLWIYGVLYLIVLVGVVIAAFQQSFLNKYPFLYTPPGEWRYLLIFELFYFSQFCFLEYFFRGYMLFELEKDFGVYAIFIMVIPYCMIHFQKPFLEAMAAIVAGTILGMIALRTRSIFYGVLIHCSVALSMDVAALLRKGQLFQIFNSFK